MNFEVQLSARAEVDIDEVTEWFVSQNASDASDRWLAGLYLSMSELDVEPARHPVADEFLESGRGIRELHYGKRPNVYRIFFEVQGRVVSVLRIRHSARDVLSADEL
jgi:plasmid stabilization system protein ParE